MAFLSWWDHVEKVLDFSLRHVWMPFGGSVSLGFAHIVACISVFWCVLLLLWTEALSMICTLGTSLRRTFSKVLFPDLSQHFSKANSKFPTCISKKMKREQLKSLENIPAVTSVLPWNYFELPLLCLHMQCSSSNSPNCLTICDTDTHPFWTLLNTCWTPPRVPPSFTIASFRVAKTLP